MKCRNGFSEGEILSHFELGWYSLICQGTKNLLMLGSYHYFEGFKFNPLTLFILFYTSWGREANMPLLSLNFFINFKQKKNILPWFNLTLPKSSLRLGTFDNRKWRHHSIFWKYFKPVLAFVGKWYTTSQFLTFKAWYMNVFLIFLYSEDNKSLFFYFFVFHL